LGFYFTLAWRNIWRNKRRTLISVGSILFAVLFAIAMRSMQLGSYDNMVRNVVRFYTGYAQIHANGYWDEQSLDKSIAWNDSLLVKAQSVNYVERLIPRLESFALASNEGVTRGVLVVGVDPVKEQQLTELHKKVIDGSYFASTDRSLLLTSDLAQNLGASTGDTVVLLGQGYHGASAAGKYVVNGIVKFNNPELNKRFIFMPLAEAQWLFAAEDRITALVVMTQPKRVNAVTKDLSDKLGDEYEVMGWRQMLPELVQSIEIDNIGGIIVLWILYIVVGFGIFGTILMMIAERRHEFGVLIAIGMKKMRLATVLIIETILLTILGVVSGMAVSLPLVVYFHFNPIPLSGEMQQVSESYGIEAVLPFSLAPEIFLYQALAVLIIGLIAGLYPLFNIWKLHPSEAMRS